MAAKFESSATYVDRLKSCIDGYVEPVATWGLGDHLELLSVDLLLLPQAGDLPLEAFNVLILFLKAAFETVHVLAEAKLGEVDLHLNNVRHLRWSVRYLRKINFVLLVFQDI